MSAQITTLNEWRQAVETMMFDSLRTAYECQLLQLMAAWYWAAFTNGVEQKANIDAHRTLIQGIEAHDKARAIIWLR